MTPATVLDTLHAAGGRLGLRAGKLHVSAPRGVLTSALQADIAAHKDALLAVADFPLSDGQLRSALESAYQASEAAPDDDAKHLRFVALLHEYERREGARGA